MFASNQLTNNLKVADLPSDYFNLIPQNSIQQKVFDGDPKFNSIWDMTVSSEGRVFVAICAELNVSASALFYEYIPSIQKYRYIFDIGEVTVASERCIPPSKIHTSMSWLPDGKLIMTTHTTAQAKGHPAWMLDAFYGHPWEGYAGSHVLIYDPQTDKVENLGSPLARDTIYGAAYDGKHHALYFSTWLRGYVYRFDLKTKKVKELGQASEFGSFRLVNGPDENIYIGSRSGRLMKIDVDLQQLVDTDVDFPINDNKYARSQRLMTYGAVGKDKNIYFTAAFCDDLIQYNPFTNQMKNMGCLIPKSLGTWDFTRLVQGLCFDGEGRLWYNVLTSTELSHLSEHLVHWDLFNEGQPTSHGLHGTLDRAAVHICEMHCHGRYLYAADTNHSEDSPAMNVISIDEILKNESPSKVITKDVKVFYPFEDGKVLCKNDEYDSQYKRYHQCEEHHLKHVNTVNGNPWTIQAETMIPIRVWKKVGIDSSQIRHLRWLDSHKLEFICGNKTLYKGIIIDSEIVELNKFFSEPCRTKAISIPNNTLLPHRPGRQFRANLTASCEWMDETFLIGTEDSMLGIYNKISGNVFNLGGLSTFGKVHSITSSLLKKVAYGVAGDSMDLGLVFRFTVEKGVEELGRIFSFSYDPKNSGAFASSRPTTCLLSPDGETLAIGVEDRLGCIYLYKGVK